MQKERNQEIYALTGASSTGKTTLFETLQKLNLDWSFAEEAARKYYQQNEVPKEQRGSYENQSKIQDQYLRELEEAILQNKDIVITDSSILSGIAYAMQRSSPEIIEKLKEDIVDKLAIYSLFLLLNPEDINYHHDSSDPVRMETEQERMQVHHNLLILLTNLNLPFELISGTVEERIDKINQLILNK